MTDFHVRPPELRDFAASFEQLEAAMSSASTYTATWVDLGASANAGSTYVGVRDRVLAARATLAGVYGPGGSLTSYYRDAAQAMRDIAADYEAVDASSRAQFDELLALCGNPDYVDDTTVIAHRGETAGVDPADLASTLVTPGDTLVETMEVWQTVADVVGTIVSLQWVVWMLTGGPVDTSALAEQIDELNGDWGEVHRVSTALGSLSDFHFRASGEVGAAYNQLWEHWQGHAANAAYASLGRFVEHLDTHAEALRNVEQLLNSQAWNAVLWGDLAVQVLYEIIDLFMLDPTAIDSSLTRVLRRLSFWVTVGRLALDMVIGAVHGLGVLVGGLEDLDLDFPRVGPPPSDIGDGAP